MKILEHVEEGLIRQRVEIDEMQCGFMIGCGTTDAIFIVCQLQEKHLIANKPLYMAFVYLEKKAFDCVHQDFIWLAMPTLGTEEWLVHLVQSLYKDVRSWVRVRDLQMNIGKTKIMVIGLDLDLLNTEQSVA